MSVPTHASISLNPKSFYEILGVNANATQEEIKKRYRALSLIHHPDRPGGDDAAFKQIGEAYTTLSDEISRRAYDEAMLPEKILLNDEIINEIFTKMFSSHNEVFTSFAQSPFCTPLFACHLPTPPAPILYSLLVSIQDLYDGGVFEFTVDKICYIQNLRKTIKEECRVEIQPGAIIGETIILKNTGHSIDDLIFGDVHVKLYAKPDKYISQRGIDMVIVKRITLKEALCGGVFKFNHPSGKCIRLNNVGENVIISPGMVKTFTGLGFRKGNLTGKLIIEFIITFPEKLDVSQIDALRDIL